MKYSIVNEIRQEAKKSGEKGVCICCNSETVSYCGPKQINHWRHKSKNCDNWYENETVWHRQWKNNFPIINQEVIKYDLETGEKHIADVFINGLVIEFQNSFIPKCEIESRELFYKKMIWIVNAENFKIKIASESILKDSIDDLKVKTLSKINEINDKILKIKSKKSDLFLNIEIWLKNLDNFLLRIKKYNDINSNFDKIYQYELIKSRIDPFYFIENESYFKDDFFEYKNIPIEKIEPEFKVNIKLKYDTYLEEYKSELKNNLIQNQSEIFNRINQYENEIKSSKSDCFIQLDDYYNAINLLYKDDDINKTFKYEWKYKNTNWENIKFVFFDFGDEYLYRLRPKEQLIKYTKKEIINRILNINE